MKIERVDENTIKCYLSNEELAHYDVEYTDFLSRTDKAQRVMQDIIRQAEDEVGYQPPKFAFEMQIMMVPEQGMVLTFSEKEPFDIHDNGKVEALLNNIKDFVGKLMESRGEGTLKGNTAGGLLPGAQMPGLTPTAQGKKEALQNKSNKAKLPEVCEAVFEFICIADIMDFSDMLPANLRVETTLYKMDGLFFLHMKKGGASYDRYSKACVQALEFGSLFRADKGCDDILKEHGECLIAEKAVKKLRAK